MAPAKRATEGRGRLLLLLGFAVVLGGVLLRDQWADWSSGNGSAPAAAVSDKSDAAAAAPGGEAEPGGERREPHPLASLSLDRLHDTVRRPLFEKTRRPVEPPPKRAPAAPAPPPAAPRRVADPNALTLLGVLTSERGSAIALLRRNQTGQHVRLQEGDTVDGWTIERIEVESVVLRQGDAKIALQLFRKR